MTCTQTFTVKDGRSVASRVQRQGKILLERGIGELFGVMKLFHTLIIMGAYICQNAITVHLKWIQFIVVNYTSKKVDLKKIEGRRA